MDRCPREDLKDPSGNRKSSEGPRTQATRCTNTLQLGSNRGLRVLDLVTFIQHTVVPPLAFEPPVFCHERVVRGNAHVEGRFPVADLILESDAF